MPKFPTRRSLLAALLILPLWAFQVTAQTASRPPNPRPTSWARPITLAGAPKLHQVADNFYRSAQPDAEGFRALTAQYGIRTVVSLRAFNADEELAGGLGLRLERFRIHTWRISQRHIVGALRALRLAEREGPVLLHCQHGADRTGMITALYRILYQGWSKQDALDEMRNGDFGFHPIWGNIPRYIRSVDVEQLRRDVAVP